MTAEPPLAGILSRILPPGVASSAGRLADPGPGAYPQEEAAVAGAIARRRAEFRCGRLHARAALARLGVADGPIPRRPDRTPLWPKDTVGSISHSGRSVAAVAARTADFAALGVDVESAAPLEEELLGMVCSPAELTAIRDAGAQGAEEGKLLFSIKEAVFKALFPLGGLILDFADVAVSLDRTAHAFSAVLTDPRHRALHGAPRLAGRYAFAEGEVVAVLWLPADGR